MGLERSSTAFLRLPRSPGVCHQHPAAILYVGSVEPTPCPHSLKPHPFLRPRAATAAPASWPPCSRSRSAPRHPRKPSLLPPLRRVLPRRAAVAAAARPSPLPAPPTSVRSRAAPASPPGARPPRLRPASPSSTSP